VSKEDKFEDRRDHSKGDGLYLKGVGRGSLSSINEEQF